MSRARRSIFTAGCACLAATLAVSACGSETRYDLPPLATTVTTIPSTIGRVSTSTLDASAPTTTTVQTGAWMPAAANLVGLPSDCGNLALVTTRPDRDELIVAVVKQGLWSMTAGSTTWERMGQGPGSTPIANGASRIVFDPKNPDIFWESGAYGGAAVYRTNDGGKTFRALGNISHSDPVAIDFSSATRATMLSGQHETSNLRRTTDGGATWTELGSVPVTAGFATYPLVLNATTFLLGTHGGTKPGILRSTDAGATWTQVFTGNMNSVPLVTGDGSIYWLVDNGAVLKSSDQGVNWTTVRASGLVSPVSNNMITLLPDGRLATLGRYLLVSADKGVTWTTVGPPLPYPPNGFAFSPFRNEFYIWRFDCNYSTTNAISENSIMKLSLKPAG